MNNQDRRSFLKIAAAAGALSSLPQISSSAEKKPLHLGLFIGIDENPEPAIVKVNNLGLPTCMVYPSNLQPETAKRLKNALDQHGIEATAVVTLGPGNMVWDFMKGPSTIGLVPRETRQARIDAMKKASDFGAIVGIPSFQTHCGFIPENPAEPLYAETVEAIKEVASHCRGNHQWFLGETGQESPTTLLRVIQDVGLDNIGAALDTANLILYGKGNPVDAMDVLGKHVHSVHAKDGLFPTDPVNLGKEVPLGEGKVDFRKVIQLLVEYGYTGAITIERETSGSQQIEDVKKSIIYLEKLIGEITQKK